MKVLEINTEKTWRGGERQTLYTIKGLNNAGIRVELLCRRDYPLSAKIKPLNTPIHEVKNQMAAVIFLIKYGSTFDIIHAQTAKAQSIAILTKMFHKKPVVYTRRVDFKPEGSVTRLKYKLTDRVIAISSTIKNILEEFGVANIDVIPSAVVENNLNRKRAEVLKKELCREKQKIIATVAALVPHKDPFTMVETIHELSTKRDDFIFLHFGDGTLREAVSD